MIKTIILTLLVSQPLFAVDRSDYIMLPVSEKQLSKLKDRRISERVEKIRSNQNFETRAFASLQWDALTLWEVENFLIPVEEDITVLVIPTKRYWDDRGKLHVQGKIWNDRFGKANIVMSDLGVSANLEAGGKSYSVVSLGEGYQGIYSFRESLQQERAHADEMRRRVILDSKLESVVSPQSASTTDNFIDIMVVYTDDVAANNADPESTIESHVDYTNQALEDSCANFRMRLVHMEQVTYAETGSASVDLDCITNPSDACLDNVHALRDTHGADLVQFVTDTSDYCGLAWAPATTPSSAYGFSTKLHYCAGATMAHEFGHNMTLNHDRYEQNLLLRESGPYGGGYGFVDLTNKSRTIMSYADQCADSGFVCNRIGLYSNPNIQIQGIQQGEADFIDSTKKLNGSFETIAAFKAPATSYSVDINPNCVAASDENKDIHCFIATAAYGSYLHKDVQQLRDFRDKFLKGNAVGEVIISGYYALSPKIAYFISARPVAKKIVRWLLTPIVFIVSMPWTLLVLLGLSVVAIFHRKVFILSVLFVMTLTPENGSAFVTRPSLFKNDMALNPATLMGSSKGYLGFSQRQQNSEGSSDFEGSAAATRAYAGFSWTDGGVALEVLPGTEEEVVRNAQALGTVTDINTFAKNHLNLGASLFGLPLGLKYIGESIEEERAGAVSIRKTEQQTIGLGGLLSLTESIKLGGGVDYVSETGSDIPDTNSLETYLGIGTGMDSEGQKWMAELIVTRKPEIVQSDGTVVNVKGERIGVGINAQTEFSGGESFGGPMVFGISYLSTTSSNVENYIQDDAKSSLVGISIGLLLLEKSLDVNLTYSTETFESSAKEKQTEIGLNLIYNFSSSLGS